MLPGRFPSSAATWTGIRELIHAERLGQLLLFFEVVLEQLASQRHLYIALGRHARQASKLTCL